MKRLAATAATLAALTLIPAPAHADPPDNLADCQAEVVRLVNVGNLLAWQASSYRARIDDLTVRVQHKQARIVRLLARVERLRGAR